MTGFRAALTANPALGQALAALVRTWPGLTDDDRMAVLAALEAEGGER